MTKPILLLDNFDSFTYNLADYFQQEKVEYVLVRNNCAIEKIKEVEYSGIVISPGPGKPEEAGITMTVLDYYQYTIPILGICLGHQAIGKHFGCTVKKAKVPMHGKISTVKCKQDPILEGIPNSFNVVRYHSLILDHLTSDLISLGETMDDEIMIIKHKDLSIYGIQYHPEAFLTEYGKKIVHNWIYLNKIRN